MQQRVEITVHYFAKLRDLTNKEQESFETEINSTPKDVYLEDKDKLVFIPPVTGG